MGQPQSREMSLDLTLNTHSLANRPRGGFKTVGSVSALPEPQGHLKKKERVSSICLDNVAPFHTCSSR